MRVLVPALLVAISALSGCGKSEAPPPAQTPEVGIVTLEAQTVTLNTELPGRTNAFRIAEVRPQVNGIILKRLFKEGSDVKAGQQLYQIDPATYEADYQSAQANLASTQEQAQRYKLLVADQAVSKQQYADANAAYLQSKAAVEQARINLRYTKVLSPISGRIGRSAVTEGLNAGDKIITEGLQFVQPGVEVKTVPAKNVASAQKADAAPAKTDSKG